jgi:hypothetical protein
MIMRKERKNKKTKLPQLGINISKSLFTGFTVATIVAVIYVAKRYVPNLLGLCFGYMFLRLVMRLIGLVLSAVFAALSILILIIIISLIIV